jgi:2-dehydro-3-deoxygalactonokinase
MRRKCVLGDWGTSRLRLFLQDGDAIVDSLEGPGIGALASVNAEARVETLATLIAPWTGGSLPIRVILCGMAGARNGLCDVPYAPSPVNFTDWVGRARTIQTHGMKVTIAAGVRSGAGEVVAEVMRGEETQIFGALQLEKGLGRGTHVSILPGTHSKWVESVNGSITRFRTAMTGELYALLREHSTLFRTDTALNEEDAECHTGREQGFGAGVECSANLSGGLLAALFQTRVAQLLDDRPASWAEGFLSGLLIGYEARSLSHSFRATPPICLIGDLKLALRYQTVFSTLGIETQRMDGAECATAGLLFLRKQLPDT